jgi:hypothetical protein
MPLAERIVEQLRIPFVDLDALNWLPNWQGLNDTDPARLDDCFPTESPIGEASVIFGMHSTQDMQLVKRVIAQERAAFDELFLEPISPV